MPRHCGPCSDPRRNELDRRLLAKELTGESFRQIVADFGHSETALRRHLANHLTVHLADVHATMERARQEALSDAKERELERTKAEVKEGMASRLENAASFLDQLREVRRKAADLLDQAEKSQDLKAAGIFIRELREQVRLWAELEGKLARQPQITIINHPEWIELRGMIIAALDPYPEAKEALVNAIRGR